MFLVVYVLHLNEHISDIVYHSFLIHVRHGYDIIHGRLVILLCY